MKPDRGWDADRPDVIALAEWAARVLIAPLVVAYRLRLISFRSVGQLLSLVPGALGLLIRRAWYRTTLASCGERLKVSFGAIIARADTRIGDDCHFGEFNRVGFADVGPGFLSANNVTIMSGRRQHAFDRRDLAIREQERRADRVTIGEDVWAGAQTTIAADVASHSVIAAGAVVTGTFPPWSVLAGVPAKVLRERP